MTNDDVHTVGKLPSQNVEEANRTSKSLLIHICINTYMYYPLKTFYPPGEREIFVNRAQELQRMEFVLEEVRTNIDLHVWRVTRD